MSDWIQLRVRAAQWSAVLVAAFCQSAAAATAPTPSRQDIKSWWEGGVWTADIGAAGGWMSGYRDRRQYADLSFTPSNPVPLNADAARQELTARRAVRDGEPVYSPEQDCHPAGMPHLLVARGGFEAVVGMTEIVMLNGNWDYRRIYLDGRTHPDPELVPPTYNGHSVGHWEGRTLVIDTANIRSDNTQIEPHMPHPAGSHIVERYTPVAPGRMDAEMTMTNPAFTRPWVVAFHLQRKAGASITEHFCTDKYPTNGRFVGFAKH